METSVDLEQIYILNHSNWRKIERNGRPPKIPMCVWGGCLTAAPSMTIFMRASWNARNNLDVEKIIGSMCNILSSKRTTLRFTKLIWNWIYLEEKSWKFVIFDESETYFDFLRVQKCARKYKKFRNGHFNRFRADLHFEL